MSAAVTFGYVAQMQESGVPVTYAYTADAHDAHPSGPPYGPGKAGYVAALKSYDDAFKAFFDRLAADGINKHNTQFVFKQLTAPFGRLATASLVMSTNGIISGTYADDGHYLAVEAQLTDFTNRRDALADHISHLLDNAEFLGTRISRRDAVTLTDDAWNLIEEVEAAAP